MTSWIRASCASRSGPTRTLPATRALAKTFTSKLTSIRDTAAETLRAIMVKAHEAPRDGAEGAAALPETGKATPTEKDEGEEESLLV